MAFKKTAAILLIALLTLKVFGTGLNKDEIVSSIESKNCWTTIEVKVLLGGVIDIALEEIERTAKETASEAIIQLEKKHTDDLWITGILSGTIGIGLGAIIFLIFAH